MKTSIENSNLSMTDQQLAGYFRDRLDLALSLACQAEHERRRGRRKSANAYHRRWEEAMAEVKRLSPLLKQTGITVFHPRGINRLQSTSTTGPGGNTM